MIDVVIEQPGFLGDAVLATGLVSDLHASAEVARVGFVVRAEFASLFDGHPGIDRLFTLEKGSRGSREDVVREVKASGFDVALVPHRSARSAYLAWKCRIPTRVGFRQAALSFLYSRRVEYAIGESELQRNRSLVEAAGLGMHATPPKSWLIPDDSAISERQSDHDDSRLVVVAPGSVWKTKQWPEAKYVELVRTLHTDGLAVKLIGSKSERDLCSRIERDSGLASQHNLAGILDLKQVTALLSRADLAITNDSAPLHIAEAVGTPVVSIFGPTAPGFGFGPFLPASHVVEINTLSCRPCGIHGAESCPIGTHECMNAVASDVVYRLACRTLNGATTGFE